MKVMVGLLLHIPLTPPMGGSGGAVDEIQAADTVVLLTPSDELKTAVALHLQSIDERLTPKQRKFFNDYAYTMVEEGILYNVAPSIKLAQAAIESECATSRVFKATKALYGVKTSTKSRWNSHHTTLGLGEGFRFYDRHEGRSSRYITFKSPWWSIRQHSLMVTGKKSRYKLEGLSYQKAARKLETMGYATILNHCRKCHRGSEGWNGVGCKAGACRMVFERLPIGEPIYAELLTSYIRKYHLHELDEIAAAHRDCILNEKLNSNNGLFGEAQ